MRRNLFGATLVSVAPAAVMLFGRTALPPERLAFAPRVVVQPDGIPISRHVLRQASNDDLKRLKANLLRLLGAVGPVIPEIDPEISLMDCRIVTTDRIDHDQFLLTEECVRKGGQVERRRFSAFRKGDGPSQGWMYQLADSDI